MMPSLNDLINNAKNADWSWFEEAEKRMNQAPSTETKAARQRLASAAARIFDGADGELLLQTLIDTTLMRQIFVTQLGVDPMQAHVYGAFREGQNAVVSQILKLIAEGRGDTPPAPRENA